jgi:hypothetical protein
MRHTFGVDEMQTMTTAEPFEFTKGCPTMKIDGRSGTWSNAHGFGSLLFDIDEDPGQQHPLADPAAEAAMTEHIVRLMKENDAPAEQWERLGLA